MAFSIVVLAKVLVIATIGIVGTTIAVSTITLIPIVNDYFLSPGSSSTLEPTTEPISSDQTTLKSITEPTSSDQTTSKPTTEPTSSDQTTSKPTTEPTSSDQTTSKPTTKPTSSDQTTSKPTTEPISSHQTTLSTLESTTVKPQLELAEGMYYFPKLGKTFFGHDYLNANKSCKLEGDGYKLAGLEMSNPAYISAIDQKFPQSDILWGVYAPSKFAARYENTMDTVLNRGIGLFCDDLATLQPKIESMLTNSLTDNIVPFVKKASSKCLSLITLEEYRNMQFQALCVRKGNLYMEEGGKMYVPKFFFDNPTLLDTASNTIPYMRKKLKCIQGTQSDCDAKEKATELDGVIRIRSSNSSGSPYFAGFSQTVDLNMAKAICEMMRSDSVNSAAGQLLTYDLLNNQALMKDLQDTLTRLAQDNQGGRTPWIHNEMDHNANAYLRIPTELYFDISYYTARTDGVLLNTTKIILKRRHGGKIEDIANYDNAFEQGFSSKTPWCEKVRDTDFSIEELKTYISTMQSNPPPKEAPVGLRMNPSYSSLCLFVAVKDLTYPGRVGWLPTCQLNS